jgi:hypothetical protein
MSSTQPKPTWPVDPGCELSQRAFEGTAYRVGRSPDPWAWAPRELVGKGRWDDPERIYRVMYSSDQRRGAVLEKLSALARNDEVAEGVARIGGPRPFPTTASGIIPRTSLTTMRLGSATLEGTFADLAIDGSVTCLREILRDKIDVETLSYIEPEALRETTKRSPTQMVSRFIYERSVDNVRAYAGIRSNSAADKIVRNWNLFEGGRIVPGSSVTLDPNDQDVADAASALGIQFSR